MKLNSIALLLSIFTLMLLTILTYSIDLSLDSHQTQVSLSKNGAKSSSQNVQTLRRPGIKSTVTIGTTTHSIDHALDDVDDTNEDQTPLESSTSSDSPAPVSETEESTAVISNKAKETHVDNVIETSTEHIVENVVESQDEVPQKEVINTPSEIKPLDSSKPVLEVPAISSLSKEPTVEQRIITTTMEHIEKISQRNPTSTVTVKIQKEKGTKATMFIHSGRKLDNRFYTIDREEYGVPSYVSLDKVTRMKLTGEDYVAVTGADHDSFHYVLNLIYSIADNNMYVPVVFHDFGLTEEQRNQLWECFEFIQTRRESQNIVLFYYRKVNLKRFNLGMFKAGGIAYKSARAILLVDTIQESHSRGFWFDANDEVLPNFKRIVPLLEQYGFISPRNNQRLKYYMNPETLAVIDPTPTSSVLERYLCTGGLYGFDYDNHTVWNHVALRLRSCAYYRDCFYPVNSTVYQNRFDESIISYLSQNIDIPFACRYYPVTRPFKVNMIYRDPDTLERLIAEHRSNIERKYPLL